MMLEATSDVNYICKKNIGDEDIGKDTFMRRYCEESKYKT